jgi:hypothetical protein
MEIVAIMMMMMMAAMMMAAMMTGPVDFGPDGPVD